MGESTNFKNRKCNEKLTEEDNPDMQALGCWKNFHTNFEPKSISSPNRNKRKMNLNFKYREYDIQTGEHDTQRKFQIYMQLKINRV